MLDDDGSSNAKVRAVVADPLTRKLHLASRQPTGDGAAALVIGITPAGPTLSAEQRDATDLTLWRAMASAHRKE